MRFKIATLLGITLLASVGLSIFYKPHPPRVMEMLEHIEDLPNTIVDGKIPDSPGPQLTAVTMNDRKNHIEFFCQIEGDYFLLSLIHI